MIFLENCYIVFICVFCLFKIYEKKFFLVLKNLILCVFINMKIKKIECIVCDFFLMLNSIGNCYIY